MDPFNRPASYVKLAEATVVISSVCVWKSILLYSLIVLFMHVCNQNVYIFWYLNVITVINSSDIKCVSTDNRLAKHTTGYKKVI